MTKRIKLITGIMPYLIIAPHGGGPTDKRSARMAGIIAEAIDGFAVINFGWVRPVPENISEGDPVKYKTVDLDKGIANLNDLRQCRQKPLNREFLKPIDDYKNTILGFNKVAFIFLIHGMDDMIRDYKGINTVIGYGAGDPPRHSCSLTFKDRFISCLNLEKLKTAQGKSGGRLSAWKSHNLNQLYSNEQHVISIQVELALSLRNNDEIAVETALKVAKAIDHACKPGHVTFLKNIPER